MALTKSDRDALPADHFAVPSVRALPIHDAKHVRMAWDMVDRTNGLSDSERTEARRRIKDRAEALGLDVSEWGKNISALSLVAMSLELPADDGHPNRMPFTGTLVRLDQPSDKSPGGANGKLILMTKTVAEKSLASLLGMGVNYKEKFDGHDPQKKIGVITLAEVRTDTVGPFIYIEGIIYASDFPNAAARIRATKDKLGFSFEGRSNVADPGADLLEITGCVFTGAAILEKSKAAYMTTAIAATAETQEDEENMITKEELAIAIAAAMKPVMDKVGELDTKITAAADPKKVAEITAASTMGMIEPHAAAMEGCADRMEAAGIGGHPTRGHVAIMRNMAKTMRASAAMGQVPHVFRDHDFFTAAADTTGAGDVSKAVTAAVEAALKPMGEKVDALGTTVTDLKTKAFNAAAEPARKTLSPDVANLLQKAGVTINAAGEPEKKSVTEIDALFQKAGMSHEDRMVAKTKLLAGGYFAEAAKAA